jgi:hypothetical protein
LNGFSMVYFVNWHNCCQSQLPSEFGDQAIADVFQDRPPQ